MLKLDKNSKWMMDNTHGNCHTLGLHAENEDTSRLSSPSAGNYTKAIVLFYTFKSVYSIIVVS